MKKKLLFIPLLIASALVCMGQTPAVPTPPGQAQGSVTPSALPVKAAPVVAISPSEEKERRRQAELRKQLIARAEDQGVNVRIKDIAHFKGVVSNQLQSIGLVVGLNGTGDTQNTPFTAQLLANAMNDKTFINAAQLNPKNVAVVFVTAELPPFSLPGNRIDVNVQSMGDATSLQGGYLLRTPLFGPQDIKNAYVVAMGPVSIGGFNVAKSGSSVQKNHTTTGLLPELGIVIQGVKTQLVFDGKMTLQLNQEDFTTAQRLAEQVNSEHAEYEATAVSGGEVELSLPPGKNTAQAMSEIEAIRFFADTPATVVISENTGDRK